MITGQDCVVIGGMGYVGKATRLALDIPHYFDLVESNISLEEAAKKLMIFFCVPTPTDGRGQQKGIDLIRSYIEQLKEYGGRNIFVIRSTVLPGTCKALSEEFGVMVCSNPELLSQETWEHDAMNPRITIIGADSEPAKIALVNLWKARKAKIEVVTNTVTAETLKYAFNTFFVTKIVFANAIYDSCVQSGADYKVIREALMQHPWGSKHHFKAIHKGGRGGGGACLPKDISAFASFSNSEFFKLVKKINADLLETSFKE